MTVRLHRALIAIVHFASPTYTAAWHALHLVAQPLYSLPILLAAAWLGVGGNLWTVAVVRAIPSGARKVTHPAPYLCRGWVVPPC